MTTSFSVVTLSLNQGMFLRQAMDSVLAQSGVDIEYFVCDPGSTDGSRDIIASYDDSRVRPLLRPDSGPGDALNRAFAEASGDVFYYVNSDDLVSPDAFARVDRFLRRRPDVDVVCGHADVIDEAGETIRRVWSEPFRRYAVAIGAHVQIQPATFIRADAFRASGGFDVSDRANWDGGLLTSLHLAGASIAVIDETLGSYRIHGDSITASGALHEQHLANAARNFERLLGRPPHRGDRVAGMALRLVKHLRHPPRTLERIRRGPLFGSIRAEA